MNAISETFSNLEPDKQLRIINAAYKEFADRGYEQASTNRIVREAGIGKGMLFYYFQSKKDLFYYLIEHGIDYMIKEYLPQLDDSVTDIIEKYEQAARVKMKAYASYPDMFNFFGNLYLNKEVVLTEALTSRLEKVRNMVYLKRFANIDTSVFREDVAPGLIIKLIHWTLEGYENELINRLKGEKLSSIDFEPYWDEFFNYLDVLKKVYYKAGRQKDDSSENR